MARQYLWIVVFSLSIFCTSSDGCFDLFRVVKKISLVYDVGSVDCLTVSVQGRFKHLAFVFLEVVLSLSYGLHDSFVVVS